MTMFRVFRRPNVRPSVRPQGRRRPLVEALEGRQLLTTFSVTNLNDSGSGSLRQAIISSNATNTPSTPNAINFTMKSGTLTLASPLPAITQPVSLNGVTNPGTANPPQIVLDGSKAGASAVGLDLKASHISVVGLVVDDFATGGILVDGGEADFIADDYIGVTASGNVAKGNGYGVTIQGGAQYTLVSGDVISGNASHGLVISGAGTSVNQLYGSFVGTNAAGTAKLGNGDSGVLIQNSASNNFIGGATTFDGNVIAGNMLHGVVIQSSADGNTVQNNFIGTNAAGAALGNAASGVMISGSASGNIIGGSASADANTISRNGLNGVILDGAGEKNLIEGDVINSNGLGQTAAGMGEGVYVESSPDNSVTDCTIESNGEWGLLITDSSSTQQTGNTFLHNGLGSVDG